MQARERLKRLVEAARRFAAALGPAGTSDQPPRAGLALGAPHARRWLVIVFAPHAGAQHLAAQRAFLSASRDALAERDAATAFVVGDEVGADKDADPGVGAAALRARFGVPRNAFRVILIGKDGAAKVRSSKPLQARTLLATIDSRPLRQQEKRERKRLGGASPSASRSSLKRRAALRK